MGDAQDMYEHAMQQTGIDDPAEALESLMSSYSREESYESDYDDFDDEMKYDIGDTVRLQSGGPLLTVQSINIDTYLCRWFDSDQHLNSAEFHKDEIFYDSDDKTSSHNIADNHVPDITINEDEIPF